MIRGLPFLEFKRDRRIARRGQLLTAALAEVVK